jgi:hypothetical protein
MVERVPFSYVGLISNQLNLPQDWGEVKNNLREYVHHLGHILVTRAEDHDDDGKQSYNKLNKNKTRNG